MARSPNPEVAPIYILHSRWLIEVLGNGDSLLTPGRPVWSVEHLDELEKDFVGQPDLTKDKRFLEKLHDQLAHVSPETVQLMAELHVVHFLIISNVAISAAKKRSDLEAILSWMPTPPPIPEDVAAVMAPGLAHPGQWVMTRRDTQLTWLIRFARAWHDLSDDRRRVMIDDPWALKTFAETIQAPAADSARLALLHLAHPDTFEPIVSVEHKRLIVERFADAVDQDEDVDRTLLAVRSRLTSEYGEGFTWYGDPLVHRWLKNRKAWKPFLEWLQRFRAMPTFDEEERTYKIDLAAKVRRARGLLLAEDESWTDALKQVFHDGSNNLTQWQVHEKFLTWLDNDPGAGSSALRALWASDKAPVTRLQSFFDQVPTTGLGPTGERLNVGSFLLMAEDATSVPPMKIRPFRRAWKLTGWGRDPDDLRTADVYGRMLVFLDELVRDSTAWDLPLRDRLDAQGAVWSLIKSQNKPEGWSDSLWQDFTTWRESVAPEVDPGEPDETTTDGDSTDEGDDLSLIDHIAEAAKDLHVDRAVLDEVVELLEDKRQVVLYGPPGTGKTYFAIRLAEAIAEGDAIRSAIVQFHPATSYEDFFEGLRPKVTSAGQVTYELTDGPLVAMAKAAESDPDRRYVMVIDEINRANLPKVFGELLFLLEYRTESVRTLYRPTVPFRLPGNLWFIGTMNTADRSVALIDAAMRRRFHFVPFFPHDGAMKGLLRRWLEDRGGRTGVASLLDAVNEELLGRVGEHLLVGPSHFMKTDLSDRALERIWTYNIFPLIEEQYWGNRDEIDRWRWNAVRIRFAEALTGATIAQGPNAEQAQGNEHGSQHA